MNDTYWTVSRKPIKVGDVFGRLTVNKLYRERYRVFAVCLCSCGTQVKLRADHIVSGATVSCGCFQAEACRALSRIRNRKALGWASFVHLYNLYRASARKGKRSFKLTKPEFKELTQKPCHYCGAAPAQEHCSGYGSYRYNGLDRVNNAEGYSLSNCVACCYTCNRAKGTSSVEAYIKWIDNLVAWRTSGVVLKAPEDRRLYFTNNGGQQKLKCKKQSIDKGNLTVKTDVMDYLKSKTTS